MSSRPAQAGWLLSPSLSWGVFSFRPQKVEKTPNYFGLGVEGQLGFSFQQFFDMAGFISYIPGSSGAVHIGKENASLVFGGAQLALRLNHALYLGLRAGSGQYHLVKGSKLEEVAGKWSGPGGGVSLGSLFKMDKQNFWQISVDVLHFVPQFLPQTPTGEKPVKRRLDAFQLKVSYTFNSFANDLVQGSLFKNVF